jgi:glycerate kinase
MKILIAADSFKGSMTSAQAGEAIRQGLDEGLRKLGVAATFDVIPIADGGEGTVDAFHSAAGGDRVAVTCRGPLGDPVSATFLMLPGGKTAVIEMAASCGLPLVKGREDILRSDTYGLGQQILAALDRKPEKILIGIGGSATNDGGAGMARALGVRFLDAAGRALGTTPSDLVNLSTVDLSRLDPRVRPVRFEAICDVTNPLLGPSGAAAVYAPQKGADPETVKRLEAIGRRHADVVEAARGIMLRNRPGTGAAGGLGFGLRAYVNATLRAGIDVVIDAVNLRDRAKGAAFLVTGEGRMDAQSGYGKAPFGIAKVAREAGVPCAAFCGSVACARSVLVPDPFAAIYEILPAAPSLDAAIANGPRYLRELARQQADAVIALASGDSKS